MLEIDASTLAQFVDHVIQNKYDIRTTLPYFIARKAWDTETGNHLLIFVELD